MTRLLVVGEWDAFVATVAGGDPVLPAKLRVPAVPPWSVVRPRLLRRLSAGTTGPLTLVSAPAGTGKTVLVSSWIAGGLAPGPVAWVSLDEEDNAPGRFWSYVLAGLTHSGVPVGGVPLPDRPDTVDRSTLARLAASLSACADPVVLVLDNAQVLTDKRISDGLEYLLRHADLRAVVLTRADPPLPLPRHRVTGSVVEIRFGHLAFTVAEARELMAAHDLDPPDDAVAALAERTRGWAAGLRLAARSWPERPDTELARYFAAEVLDAQPRGMRDFLLGTSLVERVWPGLAVDLTGRRDAGRLLANLADDELFLARTDDGYEYHPIVRDLLRDKLSEEYPGWTSHLHRTAARWFAATGRLTDAVAHTIASGDWERAAGLVVEHLAVGRLLVQPGADGLATQLAAIPSTVDGPAVEVVRSALALANRDSESGAWHLGRAQELAAKRSTERDPALRLSIAVAEMSRAYGSGDPGAVLSASAAAEDALHHLAARSLPVPPDVQALVLSVKGIALLTIGDLSAASVALTDGLRASDSPPGEYLHLTCLGQLAVIEALRGHLRRAAEFGRRASTIADRRALPQADRPSAADLALAWVQTEEYDLGSARVHADRAAISLATRYDPVSAGLLALVRARLQRAHGDAAGAAATIDEAVRDGTAPRWLAEVIVAAGVALRATNGTPASGAGFSDAAPQGAVVWASARVTHGDAAGAREAVSALLQRADLPLDTQVAGWLVAAEAELAQGRPGLARAALERALNLAAPERLRRPVVEASPALRRFFRQEREITERHGWLGTATTGAVGPARPAQRPAATRLVVEPLTDKETEVLRYLAALLSTDEIARKMFVSVNTVKTHVRGVLRKLAANRRNEAIRRARELGLI